MSTPGATAIGWTTSTALVAWCVTCGTDVEFATPYGLAPEDLAADEHACVWCGEALLVTVALGEIRGGRSTHAA